MQLAAVLLLIATLCQSSRGFFVKSFRSSRFQKKILDVISSARGPESDYKSIVVSGYISKENGFADSFVFNKLFSTKKWEQITAVSDDISFAKKRLVTPKTVYSGLIDVLGYEEIGSLKNILAGKDVWLSYNVSLSYLEAQVDLAIEAGVKRAIFAVNTSPEFWGPGVVFQAASDKLAAANIDYTIVKYSGVHLTTAVAESRLPYRIVRGALPLPAPTVPDPPSLAANDLALVLSEIIDIPKTYKQVYGIGPGTRLDAEILVYMKSQGWPERAQIAILVGDMMEKIEKSYLEQMQGAKKLDPAPVKALL